MVPPVGRVEVRVGKVILIPAAADYMSTTEKKAAVAPGLVPLERLHRQARQRAGERNWVGTGTASMPHREPDREVSPRRDDG